MEEKIILIHSFGQFDSITRADVFNSEQELKDYMLDYTGAPALAFKIPTENIIANYYELQKMRGEK